MKTTWKRLVLIVCVALCGFSASASLVPGVYNTGQNVSGGNDLSWLVDTTLGVIPSTPTLPRAGTVVTTSFPLSPWVTDSTPSSPSAWISYSSSGGNGSGGSSAPAGNYTYTTTFSLLGFDATTASLAGRWASDNASWIYLNGNPIASRALSDGGGYSWQYFLGFSAASASFVPGLNTLQVIVNNASGDGNPTGVRVDDLIVTAAVPEPTTMIAGALLLLPFGASTLRILGKSRKAQTI